MTTSDPGRLLQPDDEPTDDALDAAAAAMPAIADDREDQVGEDKIPLAQRLPAPGASHLEVGDDGTDPLAHLAQPADACGEAN